MVFFLVKFLIVSPRQIYSSLLLLSCALFFASEVFSQEMGMSRVQLYRKLKALTEQSPGDFIRIFRLQRAAQFLEQQGGNVAEVAYHFYITTSDSRFR